MKTYCALLLFSAAILVGCSQSTKTPNPTQIGKQYTRARALVSELTLTDGVYHRKGDNAPFSGLAVEFYEDGGRKEESYFSDGKLNGPQIKWYRNGSLFGVTVFEENTVKYMKEYGPDAVIKK